MGCDIDRCTAIVDLTWRFKGQVKADKYEQNENVAGVLTVCDGLRIVTSLEVKKHVNYVCDTLLWIGFQSGKLPRRM